MGRAMQSAWGGRPWTDGWRHITNTRKWWRPFAWRLAALLDRRRIHVTRKPINRDGTLWTVKGWALWFYITPGRRDWHSYWRIVRFLTGSVG